MGSSRTDHIRIVVGVDPAIPYTAVRASRGKQTLEETVSSYYEQGRINHVGTFPAIEDQMCD
ncbi:hypothetical protein HNV12_20335 [Methanococcoides sp. SA1]|nr:hypothetical protein [Methanococcoides sp. SA1]